MSDNNVQQAAPPKPYDGYKAKICPILPATVEEKVLSPCPCLGPRCGFYVPVRNEASVEIDGACGVAMLVTQIAALPVNYVSVVQQVTATQGHVPVIKRV